MRRKSIACFLAVQLLTVAYGACPADKTCVSWVGDGRYSDSKPIPSNYVVTYTIWKGIKGGPYVQVNSYNGTPTQAMKVEIARAYAPLNCFRMTATADTPDKDGKLSKQTSAYTDIEACTRLRGPTNTGVDKPTNSGVD